MIDDFGCTQKEICRMRKCGILFESLCLFPISYKKTWVRDVYRVWFVVFGVASGYFNYLSVYCVQTREERFNREKSKFLRNNDFSLEATVNLQGLFEISVFRRISFNGNPTRKSVHVSVVRVAGTIETTDMSIFVWTQLSSFNIERILRKSGVVSILSKLECSKCGLVMQQQLNMYLVIATVSQNSQLHVHMQQLY